MRWPHSWKYQNLLFLRCQQSSNKLAVNSIWINNSISEKRYKFHYMKHIFLWETRTAKNLHIVKNVMPMNESYHISRLRSLRNFTAKLPGLWHLLDLYATKNGKKMVNKELTGLTRLPLFRDVTSLWPLVFSFTSKNAPERYLSWKRWKVVLCIFLLAN